MTALQMRAKASRMHRPCRPNLFVIDYLQPLHSTARRAENRQQEIADISSGNQPLAEELDVPVIVLSQLSRELERDKNRQPRLSSLKSIRDLKPQLKSATRDVPQQAQSVPAWGVVRVVGKEH